MKPQPNFTLDEIVGTLTELSKREIESKGLITVKEICGATGWGRERIRSLLGALKKEGRLEVGRKRIEFLDGRVVDTPAYKLKSKEEEKE